jgi:hypothetical protein
MLPNEFFTTASFGTLVGLTGITYILKNTLHSLTGWQSPWIGFLIAVFATEIGVYLSGGSEGGAYLLGALNGCLVFLTAGGAAGAVHAVRSEKEPTLQSAEPTNLAHRFFSPWF